jgi:uncharacterized membrane protein YgcG
MKNLTLAVFLLLAHLAGAQTFSIKGKIVDENNGAMPGATVSLQHPWGEVVKGTATTVDGTFALDGIGKGGYRLVVTALGYSVFKKEVTVTAANVQLGTLALEPDPVVLKDVEIKSTVPISQQKGDTTEFNANAVKVMKDADASDLIEKLPSVTVENGTIKAQGENVTQVLVDGKPFFGNDPAAALRNLPAEVIDKVQIFDQQSDQAQFTGFQDGNTTKTINIVTRTDMRSGQFGKVYAGYGYEDRYQGGGNINYFDGDRRISLIGMTNNINVQNFSSDDLLGVMGSGGRGGAMGGRMSGGGMPGGGGRQGGGGMGGGGGDFLVRPQGGIATTTAVGLNFSDKWGAKTEVSASYFFNKSNSYSESLTYRQFLNNDGALAELYDEQNYSNSDNTNHRFNARIEFKLDSMNTFVLRPRLSAQLNDGNSSTLGQTTFDTDLLSRTDNTYLSDLTGLNLNTDLLWRHRLTKKGRTFSLNVSSGYAPKNGTSKLLSSDEYFVGPPLNSNLDQSATLDVNSWNAAGNAEYTEPVSENAQLLFNYRLSFQQEASDKYTYDFSPADGGYTMLNEPLSNVFSNDYITHQTGAGYNYSKGRDLNFNLRTNVQWADLANRKTFPQPGAIDQTFFNVLPSAMLRYNLDKNHNIRFNYRTSTQLPSVDQLQDVLNNSNPLQLSVGNPNLKQTFQQNLFLRYQGTNPDKGTTFFAMAGGGMTSNYIANATYLASSDHPILQQYNVPPGARISRPVNLDGYWNLRSFVSYGIPIKGLKTNFNLDLSYNFSRTPGLVNDVENFANNQTAGLGVTFASNISDRVDFTLSTRPSYNTVSNTLQTASNTEYYSQVSRLKFNWIIVEGFVLRTDLTHTLNNGLSDGFNQNFWLWNLAIGKKIFKNERGEIALAVNDLLGQNRSISRNITEAYIEDLQTNALQRFVMLSFTYNLRHFKTKKAATPRTEGPGEWGPPPGMWRG